MSTLTHDSPVVPAAATRSRLGAGLAFALVSAVSFGMSGALARGLIETGWSAGAMTLVRVGLAALALTPFGVASLRGRWFLLRRNLGLLLAYGAIAVVGAQFCYFSAVQHMQVGPAILIEFTAPAVVVVYLWLRHGQRPGRMTLAGAGLAALGLVLVLDLISGADLSLRGVLWALGAMVGCATYFIISADEDNGLPPLVLAWGGLVVGALGLALLGAVGLLPLRASTDATSYAGVDVAWWVPLLVLGLFTAALAYVAGIAAGRRLGSRLASFVALLEVVSSVCWAWLLLDELPGEVQLLGGLLILAGVVAVKLGERSVVVRAATPGAARA
jgi:drug/metabolite transporter (DMT)-like permease